MASHFTICDVQAGTYELTRRTMNALESRSNMIAQEAGQYVVGTVNVVCSNSGHMQATGFMNTVLPRSRPFVPSAHHGLEIIQTLTCVHVSTWPASR